MLILKNLKSYAFFDTNFKKRAVYSICVVYCHNLTEIVVALRHRSLWAHYGKEVIHCLHVILVVQAQRRELVAVAEHQ